MDKNNVPYKIENKIEDIEKIRNMASQIIDLSDTIKINDGWDD